MPEDNFSISEVETIFDSLHHLESEFDLLTGIEIPIGLEKSGQE